MNGKKAKRIRRMAKALLKAHGVNPNEGKNEYNQAMNTTAWANFIDPETGVLAKDPDGNLLLKPKRNPGTVTHAHKETVAYRRMKKIIKEKDRKGKKNDPI